MCLIFTHSYKVKSLQFSSLKKKKKNNVTNVTSYAQQLKEEGQEIQKEE